MEKKKLFPEPDMKMLNSNMILGHDEYELNWITFKIKTVMWKESIVSYNKETFQV